MGSYEPGYEKCHHSFSECGVGDRGAKDTGRTPLGSAQEPGFGAQEWHYFRHQPEVVPLVTPVRGRWG